MGSATPRNFKLFGELHPNSKLTRDQVIEIRKEIFDLPVKPVGAQEVAIGRGCRGKSARDSYPEVRQVADHFAERCVLPANGIDVGHAKLFELDYISLQL